VSDEDLWLLLETALRHGQELRDPAKYAGDYNHGLYQMLGLLALARALPEVRDFPEYGEYAESVAERVLLSNFSVEGVHLEHSPMYQLVLVRTLEAILDQDLLRTPRLREIHRRAQDALAWQVQPSGYLTRFGDTEYFELEPRLLRPDHPDRTAALLWVLSRGEQGAPPQAASWVAREGGFAAFRGTWTPERGEWEKVSYLAMQAGRHSRAHKQADDLTIEWSELGQPLLVDSGLFRYWPRDERRRYCMSTRAHNTVEIDQRDYDIPRNIAPEPRSAIQRWTQAGDVRVLEAEITHFDTVRHRRTLLFSPAKWLIVLDELSSPNEHEYTQWFHFHPDLELEQRGDGFVTTIGDTGRMLHMRRLGAHEGEAPIMVKGQEEPRLQGWTSIKTGEFVPNWALGFAARGSGVALVALFVLTSPDEVPEEHRLDVQENSIRVTWTLGGEQRRVRLTRGEGSLWAQVCDPRDEDER